MKKIEFREQINFGCLVGGGVPFNLVGRGTRN